MLGHPASIQSNNRFGILACLRATMLLRFRIRKESAGAGAVELLPLLG
jgi:hypothetical protein